ncbi:MAG: hypothetical protein ACRDY2_02750 [Acidimicrobiales bacterium]
MELHNPTTNTALTAQVIAAQALTALDVDDTEVGLDRPSAVNCPSR